jgi:hypothetical protein
MVRRFCKFVFVLVMALVITVTLAIVATQIVSTCGGK